jgi:hypothetical protein
MSCETLREPIIGIGRGQDVGLGTTAAVETHVAHCRSCAALLERERELSTGLRALAAETSPGGASPALERALVAAFNDRQHPSVHRKNVRSWLPLAAAAVLAIGVSAWLLRPGVERRVVPAPPTVEAVRNVPVAPAKAVANTAATPAAVLPNRVDQSAGGAGRRRPPQQRASRFIAAEGFVLLPAALGLPDFESGEIVRMELPVTSLPAYGLEIAPDARQSPVQADLLVGQDGQARAIRLVNSGRLQPNE